MGTVEEKEVPFIDLHDTPEAREQMAKFVESTDWPEREDMAHLIRTNDEYYQMQREKLIELCLKHPEALVPDKKH